MKLLNKFVVYPKNIILNIQKFKTCCSAKICAIVKADAYGHGIEGVVPSIKRYVDFFGVADEREALKVRNLTAKPILILNMVRKENLPELIKQHISLSVSSFAYLKQILEVSKKLNIKAKIHLKINSGMNRLGVANLKTFKQMLEFIENHSQLFLEGIYTHFCDSTNVETTEKQYQTFYDYLKNVGDNCNPIVHASASNGVLLNKKYQFDMVRLGIAMYGYCDLKSSFSPAIKLTSTVVNVLNVKKGQSVGYCNGYIAKKNMKVACISLGYADGLLRTNSNNGKVIINGQICHIIGNICMDLFMCDITNIKCKVGDEAVILGKENGLEISAQEMALNTNTIAYEVLTNFKRDRMNYIVNSKELL